MFLMKIKMRVFKFGVFGLFFLLGGCGEKYGCEDNPDLPACQCPEVCTGSMPHCDGASKSCVACLSSSDCPGTGLSCMDNQCFSETSTLCQDNDDCDGDLICNLQSMRCAELVVQPECSTNFDCNQHPQGPVCHQSRGVCVNCDGRAGQCLGDTPVCFEAQNRCVECARNDDCPDEGSCNLSSFSCLPPPECGPDDPCDEGLCSPDGECVECLSRDDCAPNQLCDLDHTCALQCNADADCGDVDRLVCDAEVGCRDKTCDDVNCGVPQRCDPDTLLCVRCLEDSHCEGSGNRCTADNECEAECTEDAQCLDRGQVCNESQKQCVPCTDEEPELSETACPQGKHCRELNDRLQCVGCLSHADCETLQAAQCNPHTNTCVPCDLSVHCTRPEAGRCETVGPLAGQCVECDQAIDNGPGGHPDCFGNEGGNYCNPLASPNTCVECTEERHCGGPGVPEPNCNLQENTCVRVCQLGNDDSCNPVEDAYGGNYVCTQEGANPPICTENNNP